MEDHSAYIQGEAAIGLSPQGEGEARFGVGEQDREVVVRALADLLAGRGAAPVGDHHDHQRPEADHDAQQGWDVTEQP